MHINDLRQANFVESNLVPIIKGTYVPKYREIITTNQPPIY